MRVRRVAVYCASSSQADRAYCDAATELGNLLADHDVTIVYGGGAVGPMGCLARGGLSRGGKVIGIIPQFMVDLEWAHPGLTELNVVKSMHERKARMIDGADAVIALPGGSGTLEELLEAITLKRLGIYLRPIIVVNILGFFDPLLDLLHRCIVDRFMDSRHESMWSVVDQPREVLSTIENSPAWSFDARSFAAL